jgi:solute carrier family 12 (sodium/potassium/chloride transporter), member 2
MTPDPRRRFDTFTGVFTPTLLTILGVIMYVRLGWVVGNAGLIGAWMILALALGITVCTGLSLASIASNTRIGDGGPYAIIANSLGFEVGGSVGIPLFLTRPLGVAMYVFGFREGWLWVFPNHSPMLVDLAIFALLFGIAYKSADLAFRVQYLIMAVIVLSLFSILMSDKTFAPVGDFKWFGDYAGFPENGFQGIDFWVVFAVFFPATTGILAGANMSGELKDPRRAIPVGALSAIAVSAVIYFALTLWAVRVGTPEELVSNYTIFIDEARWGWLVLAGLLGATASSALAGLVGGPRIVMAMGRHRLLPGSGWMGATAEDGEPRNAMLITGVLTLACLMVRDLNAIAPLVTMFFLITYGMLNFVVLVEGKLGLVSFRPTLRIHEAFPLFGLVGCLFAMFIVSPAFGLVSLIMSGGVYMYLQRRGVSSGDDVRSSIFVAFAEWAAAKVTDLGAESVRAWKPNLLVPVDDPEELRGEFNFLLDVCTPEGSVKLLGLTRGKRTLERLQGRIEELGNAFHEGGVYCTWSVVEEDEFGQGTIAGLQALQSAFFRPNMLFLTLPELKDRHDEFAEMIMQARRTRVGVALLGLHPRAGLGQRRRINLWLRPQDPDWEIESAFSVGSLNLTLLMGYRLMKTWKASVEMITVVRSEEEREAALKYLAQVTDLARIPPKKVRHRVMVGPFGQCVADAPVADLNIMGLQPEPDFAFVTEMVESSRGSCLMVLDSGRESALA